MYILTDETAGKSWQYDSERQLRTVTRLYAFEHPKASISVTIAGTTHRVR